ncbi:hypothetical protein THAOC_14184, partial [Thalassiosira oceanica]
MKYSSNVADAYASSTAHFSQPPQPWPADRSDSTYDRSVLEIFGATTSSRCSTISPGPDPRPVLKAHDDSSVPERVPTIFPPILIKAHDDSSRLHAISRKDRAREDEIFGVTDELAGLGDIPGPSTGP